MASSLENTKDIQKITDRLLKKANAYGVFPTPVDEIVNAAGLTEVNKSLFDESLLAKAPAFLRNKIDALKYKVLAALDRREKKVYINHDQGNSGSLAFRRLHEVTHEILPWQNDLGYADDNHNLLPSVRNLFEREANQGAAELLFQNEKFTHIAHDYQVSLSSVIDLKNLLGSSIHAAIRRYVETHSISMATIVLKKQITLDPKGSFLRNEVVMSGKWLKQFPDMTKHLSRNLKVSDYQFLKYVLAAQSKPNKIIPGNVDCKDLNGKTNSMKIEVLNTTHNIHVLIWSPTTRLIKRAKRILAEPPLF